MSSQEVLADSTEVPLLKGLHPLSCQQPACVSDTTGLSLPLACVVRRLTRSRASRAARSSGIDDRRVVTA